MANRLCYNHIRLSEIGGFMTIIMTFFIILISGAIQGISSFGFSLVAVPLLGMFLPLKEFVPVLVLFSLLTNLMLFFKVEGSFNVKRIITLVVVGTISTFGGVYILKYIDDNTLKLVVGIIIIISAVIMILGYRINIKNKFIGDVIAGFFSGLLNGSVSLSGPPVILLLSNEDAEKNTFRKTLTTFFLVLNFMSLPAFFMGGLITQGVIDMAIYNVLALAIGTFVGLKIGNMFTEKHFKAMTLGLILVMGMMNVVSAIL